MFSDLTEKQLKDLKKYIKNYKNEFRDELNIPSETQFGCEIEFNTDKDISYYIKKISSRYDVKYDFSGDDIIEVTTPIMHNTAFDWNTMKEMMDSIKYATIKSNTGGHIHFDPNIINDYNFLNFLKLWCSLENIIYDFSSGEFRELRTSIKSYAKRNSSLEDHIELIENGILSLSSLNKYDKRYGLNLANHFDYFKSSSKDTYEVRVPNGSLNINTWQNNVEFFSKIFNYANEYKNIRKIEKLYNIGKLESNFNNKLLVADMLYNNEEAKIRFLNQFELDNEFADQKKLIIPTYR